MRLQRSRLEPGHAHEVVGRGGELQPAAVALETHEAQLAPAAHGLHPAVDLLHELAPPLAVPVPGVPRGAPVHGAAATAVVLGHVRGHATCAQSRHEVARVVGLVRPQRRAPATPALQHAQRRLALGVAARLGQLDVQHQAVAVLGEQMAQVAELRRLPRPLRVQLRLRVGAGDVRLPAAPLTPEVDLPVAPATAFTFSGTSGEVVTVRMSATGAGPDPKLWFVSPSGSKPAGCSGVTSGSVVDVDCTLGETGTWPVLTTDWLGNETGSYNLNILVLNSTAGNSSIHYAAQIDANLETGGIDRYSFQGRVGDVSAALLWRSAAAADPDFDVRFIRPDGSDPPLCAGATTLNELEVLCTLDQAGSWSILVSDIANNAGGAYEVYLKRTHAVGEIAVLSAVDGNISSLFCYGVAPEDLFFQCHDPSETLHTASGFGGGTKRRSTRA